MVHIKDEIGVLGIDDGPFNKGSKIVILIGTYFRGNKILDGVYFKRIKKDGMDSTEKIVEIVKGKHRKKINVIFLDGITFGGFNIADIHEIYEKTNIPVVAIMNNLPDYGKIEKVLMKYFKDYEDRISILRSMPKPERFEDIYVQYVGIERETLELIIKKTRLRSKVPECLRVSHIIGRGFLHL
ncbi:MAG TPA: DUF99 family protein [Methanothermococcus okinawensis]|uniref:UPF0215 protein MHHB_P0124 n=1 Tax=Methanofervidicoccus abyssi TaxID=2082189 RepID=A0A401HNT6_9EURY|nr:DUF99 family protein [Methanofervidicoccus abyssi]GBF35899.1 conserved hypothetical protein [Methanofervidicoccus abyssi]HIP15656.1 DUF99 family protein [Methanothermococcus okinawensis]HIP35121.1 DUF99 family protein [Methanothermococcus okinawensis]